MHASAVLGDLAPRTLLHVGNTEPFAVYLEALLDKAGLKPAELARRANVPESALSRWLNGRTVPAPENLRKIAKPLRVGFLDLLIASGHMTEEELTERYEPHDHADETTEALARRAAYAEGLRGRRLEEAVRLFVQDMEWVKRHVPPEDAPESTPEPEADESRERPRRSRRKRAS